jgi:hypothetical protein
VLLHLQLETPRYVPVGTLIQVAMMIGISAMTVKEHAEG